MSLDPEVARELVRLVGDWAHRGKDDLAHHALDILGGQDEGAEPACPLCAGPGESIEDTGTFTAPRKTCKTCGKSWNPKEASRG